jgi:multidrug efflux pump
VTLFGIFLTPVFFFVIDYIAGWHLFSTGWLYHTGRIGLDVVRLGFVRRSARRLAGKLAAAAQSSNSERGHSAAPHESAPRDTADAPAANVESKPASVSVTSGKG